MYRASLKLQEVAPLSKVRCTTARYTPHSYRVRISGERRLDAFDGSYA